MTLAHRSFGPELPRSHSIRVVRARVQRESFARVTSQCGIRERVHGQGDREPRTHCRTTRHRFGAWIDCSPSASMAVCWPLGPAGDDPRTFVTRYSPLGTECANRLRAPTASVVLTTM